MQSDVVLHSTGDGIWQKTTKHSVLNDVVASILRGTDITTNAVPSSSVLVLSLKSPEYTFETFVMELIAKVFELDNVSTSTIQSIVFDSKMVSFDERTAVGLLDDILAMQSEHAVEEGKIASLISSNRLGDFIKSLPVDAFQDSSPKKSAQLPPPLPLLTHSGVCRGTVTEVEALARTTFDTISTKTTDSIPLFHQIQFVFRVSHTIQVEESDDDLGIELPPQTKSVLSQHTVRLIALPTTTREVTSPAYEFLSLILTVHVATKLIKTKCHASSIGADSSNLINLLSNTEEIKQLLSINNEEIFFATLRSESFSTDYDAAVGRVNDWAGLLNGRSQENKRDMVVISPDEVPINSSVNLADSIFVPSRITRSEPQSSELDALKNENRALKNQIEALQMSLINHKTLFTPIRNSSLVGSSIAGCDASILNSTTSPAVKPSQPLADSFVLPPPSELRARRNKERQLYGSFVQSLYYINTQDSFSFQYPPPLNLENASSSARALGVKDADSMVNTILSPSVSDIYPLKSVKEHHATPFVDAAVVNSEGEYDDDDESRGGKSHQRRTKKLALTSKGSNSMDYSPRRSMLFPMFPDPVSAFNTLQRSEDTQRLQIEHQQQLHFAQHLLLPFVSWLKRIAFSARSSDIAPPSVDDTAQIISEMLEDHAEGMAIMVADLVDLKGEALFEAVCQAALAATNRRAVTSEKIAPVAIRIEEKKESQTTALIIPPSQQEIGRRLEIHKSLLLTGRNPEGDRLRGLGYQLPPLKVEALQESTKLWKSTLIYTSGGGQVTAPSLTSISNITGGTNSTSASGLTNAGTAVGQHTAPFLDDYRAMCAFNFFVLGETNVGKSTAIACLTSKTPKLFKKCPTVVSPTLAVTRHQHFCSLHHSASTMLPVGGIDRDSDLNVQMIMRDDRVTYNIHYTTGEQQWPPEAPVRPQAFTVPQPTVNGTFAVNFVEIPSPILELGAASCVGEGLGYSGAAKVHPLTVPPPSACGPWWGSRPRGSFPTKGAAYFIVYDLTEDMAVSQRNIERALKNILGSLIRTTSGDNAVRTIPFILMGTHSDLLRPEDGGADRANDHHNTLQTILRAQREWFYQVVTEMLPKSAIYKPILLDSYAVSCKEWVVVGERPRSAVDFESLCASTVQSVSVHSPVNPQHMLPALPNVVLQGLFEDQLGSDVVKVFSRYLRGGNDRSVQYTGDAGKASKIWEKILNSSKSFATCSLERFWVECTNIGMAPVSVIFPSDTVMVENVPIPTPAEAKSSFLPFVSNRSNQQQTKETLHEKHLQADRIKKPCLPLVSSLTLTSGATATAMAGGFSMEGNAVQQRGSDHQLPLYTGMEIRAGAQGTSPDSSSQAVLTKLAVQEVLQVLKVDENDMEVLPSGYLLGPLLTRVMDWLSYAPYGMVTLLTALKRFADVSNVLIDGQTMTFLVHQHLGLLPYSLVTRDDKGQDAEGDGILSAVYRMYVSGQFQQYQLYLEQEKRKRKAAKRAGFSTVTGEVPNVSFGISNGVSSLEGDNGEVDPLTEELWAASVKAEEINISTEPSVSTKEDILRKCPVVGLNNEKYWPPELIACRAIIVDHVVRDLTSRGILQQYNTSPTSTCYSVGHIWKDSLLTALASLKVLQFAALMPKASMPMRSKVVPIALLNNKEMVGSAHILGTLAGASGFGGSSGLLSNTSGGSSSASERLLANLLTRVREQGMVSANSTLAGAFSPNVTYFASSGIPSEPSPWSGTHRLLISNFPVSVESLAPTSVDSYFNGFITMDALRVIANGPLRWLTNNAQGKAATTITPAARVATSLVGSLNILTSMDGYGSLIHMNKHYLMHMNRYLAYRFPMVLKQSGNSDECMSSVGTPSSSKDIECLSDDHQPTLAQSRSLLTTLLSLKTFLELPQGTIAMSADNSSLFIPQLIDRSAPRSVLDAIGFLIGVGCEITSTAYVTLNGCGSGIAPRVFGAVGATLHAFVTDIYREWSTLQVLDWISRTETDNSSSISEWLTCGAPLLEFANSLDALIRSKASQYDQPLLSSFRAWSNAMVFTYMKGIWCVIAKDEAQSDARGPRGPKRDHYERHVVIVGYNAQNNLLEGKSQSDISHIVTAVCSAICASFVREAAGFHATSVSIEGSAIKSPEDSMLHTSKQVEASPSSAHPSVSLAELLPLHHAWTSPSLKTRPISAVRQSFLPWSVVEEQLVEMSAEISLDGRGGKGAVAISNQTAPSRLLGEADYAIQAHDVMVAAIATLSNASDLGAHILATQSPLSQHLYALPMNRVEDRKKVLKKLLVATKDLVEGTKIVELDELTRLAESSL